MKQQSFADAEYAHKKKRTRREVFLSEMDRVVPWQALLQLIQPHYPKGERGRPAYPLLSMLRVHLLQNWFGYSDPGMEEALYETPVLRQFAQLDLQRIPDETTILNFRRLLEQQDLAVALLTEVNGYLSEQGLLLRQGTIVDATLIHAPSSTKNTDGKRDPEMHSTKKGNQYYFGMKAHIGVDTDTGLVHHVHCTPAHHADVACVEPLLHGEESWVSADAGYTGVHKRPEHQDRALIWEVAQKPSVLTKGYGACPEVHRIMKKVEQSKARIRAKVEHAFQILKCQFGYRKVRFKGIAKNQSQIVTLFALVNLWRFRKHLLLQTGEVRL